MGDPLWNTSDLKVTNVRFDAKTSEFNLIDAGSEHTFRVSLNAFVQMLAATPEERFYSVRQALERAQWDQTERLAELQRLHPERVHTEWVLCPEGVYFRETEIRFVHWMDGEPERMTHVLRRGRLYRQTSAVPSDAPPPPPGTSMLDPERGWVYIEEVPEASATGAVARPSSR